MNAALHRIFIASLLRHRLATALSLLAITLGVALGLAVQLIHSAALDEFGRGMRLFSGEADLQVVGPRGGFDDAVYVQLARRPEVAYASPVLEVEARLPGRERTLRIQAVDVFRVAQTTPALLPVAVDRARGAADDSDGKMNGGASASLEMSASVSTDGASRVVLDDMPHSDVDAVSPRLAALRPDALFLSAAARVALDLAPGDALVVQAGLGEHTLRVAGAVPGAGVGQVFAVMDVAAAQHVFGQIGRLTRVDLRLVPGVERDVVRQQLQALLPPGVAVLAPAAVERQSSGLSRAYRVNLTMLAAIALVTGGFLVFSTQLLSVARRRQEFALLRALGLDRPALFRGLLIEGGLLGLLGGVFGVALAYGLSALAFALIGGDLGAGFFRGVAPVVHFEPGVSVVYLMLGVLAGVAGAWLPARAALRIAPARALRAGEDAEGFRHRSRFASALACLVLAALLCLLPPLGGVPVFGYAAVALILAGAVLLLPAAVRGAMWPLSRGRTVVLRLAHARLAAAPGQAVVAGVGVVASVALAVSMAIMVSSFRQSVDDWLTQVLPADLYVRASSSSASGFLDPAALARLIAIEGVAGIRPVRYDTVRLSDERYPMTLIARPVRDGTALPLVAGTIVAPALAGEPDPAWISEAMADLLGLEVADTLSLPLAGRHHPFRVAGIWRDYARQHGAVVIDLARYRTLSGDTRTNDVGIHLVDGAHVEAVMMAIRQALPERAIELSLPGEIRAITLEIFDRTFLITYLMAAVAVLIGLFGVSTTFAALSTSRRKEFGTLRHLGLLRSQIGTLLGVEGALTAAVGVAVGMVAGGAIALVLVEVINRHSFHWSMDISVPGGMLFAFSGVLIVLAALAARLSGHQAMRQSAVLAVREDW